MKKFHFLICFVIFFWSCSNNEESIEISTENLLNGVKRISVIESYDPNGFNASEINNQNYLQNFIASSTPSFEYIFDYDSQDRLSYFSTDPNSYYDNFSYNNDNQIISYDYNRVNPSTKYSFVINYQGNTAIIEHSESSPILLSRRKFEFSGSRLVRWGNVNSNDEYTNKFLNRIYRFSYSGNNLNEARNSYVDDNNNLSQDQRDLLISEYVTDPNLKNPLFVAPLVTHEYHVPQIFFNTRFTTDIPANIRYVLSTTGRLIFKNLVSLNSEDYMLYYEDPESQGQNPIHTLIIYDF